MYYPQWKRFVSDCLLRNTYNKKDERQKITDAAFQRVASSEMSGMAQTTAEELPFLSVNGFLQAISFVAIEREIPRRTRDAVEAFQLLMADCIVPAMSSRVSHDRDFFRSRILYGPEISSALSKLLGGLEKWHARYADEQVAVALKDTSAFWKAISARKSLVNNENSSAGKGSSKSSHGEVSRKAPDQFIHSVRKERWGIYSFIFRISQCVARVSEANRSAPPPYQSCKGSILYFSRARCGTAPFLSVHVGGS